MVADESPVDLQTQVSIEMYRRMQDKVPGASVMSKTELTRFCLARFLELDDLEKAQTGIIDTDSDLGESE